MEDYVIEFMIDQGANARPVRLNLQQFTLVGVHNAERAAFGAFTVALRALDRLD